MIGAWEHGRPRGRARHLRLEKFAFTPVHSGESRHFGRFLPLPPRGEGSLDWWPTVVRTEGNEHPALARRGAAAGDSTDERPGAASPTAQATDGGRYGRVVRRRGSRAGTGGAAPGSRCVRRAPRGNGR